MASVPSQANANIKRANTSVGWISPPHPAQRASSVLKHAVKCTCGVTVALVQSRTHTRFSRNGSQEKTQVLKSFEFMWSHMVCVTLLRSLLETWARVSLCLHFILSLWETSTIVLICDSTDPKRQNGKTQITYLRTLSSVSVFYKDAGQNVTRTLKTSGHTQTWNTWKHTYHSYEPALALSLRNIFNRKHVSDFIQTRDCQASLSVHILLFHTALDIFAEWLYIIYNDFLATHKISELPISKKKTDESDKCVCH